MSIKEHNLNKISLKAALVCLSVMIFSCHRQEGPIQISYKFTSDDDDSCALSYNQLFQDTSLIFIRNRLPACACFMIESTRPDFIVVEQYYNNPNGCIHVIPINELGEVTHVRHNCRSDLIHEDTTFYSDVIVHNFLF